MSDQRAEQQSDGKTSPRSTNALSAVLDAVDVLAADTIGADFGGVALLSEDGSSLSLSLSPAEPTHTAPALPCVYPNSLPDGGISAYAMETSNAVVADQLLDDTRFNDRWLIESGIAAALVVPMFVADMPVATLGVYSTKARQFAVDETVFLENVAELLSNLVARCTAEQAERRKRLSTTDAVLSQLASIERTLDQYHRAFGSPAPDRNQQRRSQRHNYTYTQKMAVMLGDRLPTAAEFVNVRCRDLSAGGVSLLLNAPPAGDRLVVALGKPPVLTYFAAEVVHVQRQHLGRSIVYQVGCRFTGRVNL